MDDAERLIFQAWSKRPQFRAKVDQAISVIEQALAIAPAYVACSWGKDSTVLLHLAQQVQPNIPAISFDNSDRRFFDYDRVVKEYTAQHPVNLTTIRYKGDHVPDKVKMFALWNDYPVALVGVRKEESRYRGMAIANYGLLHQFQTGTQAGTWRCYPIGYWGWKDVWAYIVSNDLPYLDAYNHQSFDRGRTTDHLSKTTERRWHRTRLEEFAKIAPEYYFYLNNNYPEMFR
jgi:phosphoadenosine phosphosulfate reductase